MHIPKDELERGEWYILDARNISIGRWTGEAFEGIRTKFGQPFVDEENHWDEGPPHGTAKPICVVEVYNILRAFRQEGE